jgi:hypothetical protein
MTLIETCQRHFPGVAPREVNAMPRVLRIMEANSIAFEVCLGRLVVLGLTHCVQDTARSLLSRHTEARADIGSFSAIKNIAPVGQANMRVPSPMQSSGRDGPQVRLRRG